MGRHETQGEVSAVGAHATDTPDATTSKTISGVLGSPRFWMAPLILVVALSSLTSAIGKSCRLRSGSAMAPM